MAAGRVVCLDLCGESVYASRMELKLVSGDMYCCCCSRPVIAARVLGAAAGMTGMGVWVAAGALFLYREKLRCIVTEGDALCCSWVGGDEENACAN